MPDTRFSIYSEHDDASERLGRVFRDYENNIQTLSGILKSKTVDSKEYKKALLEMKEIARIRDPAEVYAYVDEDGNDMYTALGGGNYISSLAVKELRKLNLEGILL